MGRGAVIQTLGYGGGPGLQKFFLAPRASVWSKNKVGPAPPGPLPCIRHCNICKQISFKR